MTLKKCKSAGCNPVLQTRGDMGEGDYADVAMAHLVAAGYEDLVPIEKGAIFPKEGNVPQHNIKDHYKFVENDAANRDDFRICCLKCGKATGWRKESTDAPGAIKDFVVKQWNAGE